MRFLVDEDVFECVKFLLDEWGHDAHHVKLRPDLISEEDPAILARAVDEDRIVITFNAEDYEILHRQYQNRDSSHAGIVCCRQVKGYQNFMLVIGWLKRMLRTETPDTLRNRLVYLHTY